MRPFLRIFRCLYLITSMAPVVAGQDVELHAHSSPPDKMLPGIVTAVDVATLSVPMNGILDRIYVTEGDRISRKQPLASLDDKIALASVRLAEVMADQQSIILLARQQQEQAERFLRRVSTAHTSMAASDFELDQAQGEFDSACQLLKQAEERQRQALAQLELERAKLSSHQITAPFDGRVSRINAHVGESMNSSQPLLQIVDLRQLKVELYIPASLFGDLVVGMNTA
jgi:RND family efflux transporter MFP subunit